MHGLHFPLSWSEAAIITIPKPGMRSYRSEQLLTNSINELHFKNHVADEQEMLSVFLETTTFNLKLQSHVSYCETRNSYLPLLEKPLFILINKEHAVFIFSLF